MLQIRVCEDLDECAQLWDRNWPRQCFFDLWPVRSCFAESYNRPPYFLIAEQHGKTEGLLALSWIAEEHYFGNYPGELWQGKTWLEQNKIPARSPQILTELLASIPAAAHLRYLDRESVPLNKQPVAVDEIGYLFYPPSFGCSFETYLQSFSGKSRKKIFREMNSLELLGASYRYDHFADIEILFRLNQEVFGPMSYFADQRFLNSFERLVVWLHKNKLLRVTTLMLGGAIAAIDIGAVWHKSYTVLAGGAHPDFPGVAKMINFHHLQWACQQQMESVDFLCGDFGWKKRFHLSARPLYEIRLTSAMETRQEKTTARGLSHGL